jgi:hypothetical protein
MKTQLSLTELAAELERQSATRKDYIAPQGAITAQVKETEVVDGEERILVKPDLVLAGFNGREMAITAHAHRQLGDVLGIPGRYYDRMRTEQPELLARNINTWLASEKDERRMIRTLDGEVRAVLSPKFRPLDNFELATAILPKLLGMKTQIVSSALTETRMYIKVILPDLCDELPAGNVWGSGHNRIAEYGSNEAGKVVAALTISNSEVGNGTLRVEPSVFTTWCTNLAVMKDAGMRKYHVGRSSEATENWEIFRDETRQADDRAFFLKVSDVVEKALEPKRFAEAVAQIRSAAADRIESTELPKVVEVAAKRLALPVGAQGSILTYLAQGGDLSRWGLASAITATANHREDYESATELEHAGGAVLAMTEREWAPISRAVEVDRRAA